MSEPCGCQRYVFNCQENVRRFLGTNQREGSLDLPARNELIEQITPLIRGAVSRILKGTLIQDQEDVIQEAFLKLCDPAKLRSWFTNVDRSWFCYWAVVVAQHTAFDWARIFSSPSQVHRDLPPDEFEGGRAPGGDDGPTDEELLGRAERLRKAFVASLSKSPLEWQLVFCMRWSYFDPSTADIVRAVQTPERTVFFRLRRVLEDVARRCEGDLSREVAEARLIGTLHPLVDAGYYAWPQARRDQVNDGIRTMLAARPLKEQLVSYLKYSPLAPPPDELAAHVQEDGKTVRSWLANIEAAISRLCPLEQC
jgi:DNA-directed RNA polymerase specialized sigma24 family protein